MKIGFTCNYCLLCDNLEQGIKYEYNHNVYKYCVNPISLLSFFTIKPNFKLIKILDIGNTNETIGENGSVQDLFETNQIEVLEIISDVEKLQEILSTSIKIEGNCCKVTYLNGFWYQTELDEAGNFSKYNDCTGLIVQ
jgi:hypothetical protein